VGFPEFGRCHLGIAFQAALSENRIKGHAAMDHSTHCIVCGNQLSGRQSRFCSIDCKNDYHQGYATQRRRGLARKLELVRAKGGKCSICGYDKNLSALTFHHRDPAAKDFKLDMRSLSNRKLGPTLSESEKVILVCANCHAELHNPHLDLDSLL
jgi:hypothetical protein